jgi:23S rRNA (pseudouridine1915-N3)-methyltransferase
MRLLLICVGRPKAGPERDLATRYVERAAAGRATGFSGVELREAGESRAARPDDRKREEAKAIRGLLAPPAIVIALDENGPQMTSRSLATELGRARDQGIASAAFVIGGPDGLEPAFLASASLTLSFGAMTWPINWCESWPPNRFTGR